MPRGSVRRVDHVAARTPAPLLGEPLPVELMNTIWADRVGVHDALTSLTVDGGLAERSDAAPSADEARAWLSAVAGRLALDRLVDVQDDLGLLRGSSALGPAGADRASPALGPGSELVGVRNALRRLAAEQTGDPRERALGDRVDLREAVRLLNRAAAEGLTWPALSWSGVDVGEHLRARQPLSRVVVGALARAGVSFFASPAREDLRACLAPGCVLYFVRQHPRREWCSAACGNRARVARHYERTHHGDAPQPVVPNV